MVRLGVGCVDRLISRLQTGLQGFWELTGLSVLSAVMVGYLAGHGQI